MDGIHLANAGGVYLYNNDFHLMASSAYATGIFVDVGSDIVVINNIVVGNGISVGIRSAEATVDTASGYNDFCYHLSNYEGYWEGSDNDITGDDADPMFVGNLAWDADTWEHYMLRWDNFPDDPVDNELKSPCIDTGHPDIIDPDSTRSDMGAVPFNQVPPNEQREINKDLEHPVDYSLLSAYPNPFNASISLNFTLPVSNSVQLNVFNLNGRLIDHIRTGVLQPGRHNFQWAPQELSSGVYLIRLETGSGNSLQKVIYLP